METSGDLEEVQPSGDLAEVQPSGDLEEVQPSGDQTEVQPSGDLEEDSLVVGLIDLPVSAQLARLCSTLFRFLAKAVVFPVLSNVEKELHATGSLANDMTLADFDISKKGLHGSKEVWKKADWAHFDALLTPNLVSGNPLVLKVTGKVEQQSLDALVLHMSTAMQGFLCHQRESCGCTKNQPTSGLVANQPTSASTPSKLFKHSP
ncbi:unnamed protein product [Merluccius merluccius]